MTEYIDILAIETSCDETAAAVVRNGRLVEGSALYSQVDIHRDYGGVVPEIASRSHSEKLPYITAGALAQAKRDFSGVDVIAVTYGPGLVGALLTGVSYAKALAFCLDKPLVGVNHIAGHISANYITHRDLEPPFVCLVASGGHTQLVRVEDYCKFKLLGETRDDAAGEAFDKVARVLGLPYPGGSLLEKLAEEGDPVRYPMPQPFKRESHLDFSFSGIKTHVINMLHKYSQKNEEFSKADVAASFQRAAVASLLDNAFLAVKREGINKLVMAGGVCANGALRMAAERRAAKEGIKLYLPERAYCTDNAAMIGAAAYYAFKEGRTDGLELNADPSLELCT